MIGKTNSEGSSINLDGLSAIPSKVLSGQKFFGSGSEEIQTGTMPDKGAVSSSLNCGGSYTIPAGYHNGSGKVTANSLSSQTSGSATAGQILSGKTAWVNGSKLTGSMASQGGSTTTPGTANKTIVAANRYVTGNIVVAGDANLKAENIRKGKTIFGVVGTWQGWVDETLTVLNGTSLNSEFGALTVEGATVVDGFYQLYPKGENIIQRLTTSKLFGITNFNFISFSYDCTQDNKGNGKLGIELRNSSNGLISDNYIIPVVGVSNRQVKFDISAVSGLVYIRFYTRTGSGTTSRVLVKLRNIVLSTL